LAVVDAARGGQRDKDFLQRWEAAKTERLRREANRTELGLKRKAEAETET
jgi:hypothetical protein